MRVANAAGALDRITRRRPSRRMWRRKASARNLPPAPCAALSRASGGRPSAPRRAPGLRRRFCQAYSLQRWPKRCKLAQYFDWKSLLMA